MKIDSNPSFGEGKVHVFRPAHSDDTMLWNSFRAGDEQAFVVIFDRSIRALHNYGVKIIRDSELVQDAVQELFIELWKHRETLGETDSIKAYLYKSLRRKLFRIKSKQANKLMVELPSEYFNETSPSVEFSLMAEQSSIEQTQKLTRLLATLSKRQREVVFLRYFEEMEYEKIAVIMDINKQVVYNLVHKAIDALKSGWATVPILLLSFYAVGI
jgi:RNA polymerase sigma factor (sigma-70 family)